MPLGALQVIRRNRGVYLPPDPGPGPGPGPGLHGLTVDPNFDVDDLSPTARAWHPRAIAYLGHVAAKTDNMGSGGVDGVRGYAQEANLYHLARPVRDMVQATVQALGATRDPAFLATLDSISEDMKTALSPGWRGVFSASGQGSGSDPVAPGGNGYIEPGQHTDGIWVWKTAGNAVHTGRDVHLLDSPKTAGTVGLLSMAYHDNGETAKRDYWLNWLDSWESAWRSNRWRRGRPSSGPIFNRGDGHPASSELVFYVHMHQLTGEQRFADYAEIMRTRFWSPTTGGFRATGSPAGTAYIWNRGDPTQGATTYNMAHPMTYARYNISDALELHRLGFGNWASTETMTRIARGISQFILLPGSPPTSMGSMATARDVSGGVDRSGLPASPTSWGGLSANLLTSWSCLPMFEKWDDSGRIATWNDSLYTTAGWGESPRGYAIPFAKLLL